LSLLFMIVKFSTAKVLTIIEMTKKKYT
jgi:hypothetical protein